MNDHDAQDRIDVDERRRGNRTRASGTVKLTLASRELVGRAGNVSPSGILFYSDGELRVQVETDENGVARTRSGRLVRAQRMGDQSIGWAIEFDPT